LIGGGKGGGLEGRMGEDRGGGVIKENKEF